MKSPSSVRDKLVQAGVDNLREYGYPDCDKSNILTDEVYKALFAEMLRDNLGKGYDKEIKALIEECGADKDDLL